MPDTITLLPLPPYAPELNPVENVRAGLRANKLAITVFDSYDELGQRSVERAVGIMRTIITRASG